MDKIANDEFLKKMGCRKNLLRKLGKSEEYIAKTEQMIVNAILVIDTTNKRKVN